jgi:antirestriction protein ArdC
MTATDTARDAMSRTTAAIVDAIETGIADPDRWAAPWHRADPDAMLPFNPITSAEYTGGNRLTLAFATMTGGCAHHWATYRQWQSIGAQVRKGERGAYILRPATRKVTDADTGDETVRVIGYRAHVVFHADQVDGYTMPAPTSDRPTIADTDRADIDDAYAWAATIGIRVIESATAGASYSPALDHVTMPDRDRFHDGDGAWSTMAHECTHWTGHETRLARTFGKRFGDDAYAAEELCAELGAAMVLARRGRSSEPRPDHAHYLASWLRVLKASPDALWSVASKAEAASGYLTGRAIDIERAA